MHWRRKWQPTPVFLPGESQGRGSLVGFSLWGLTESDTGNRASRPGHRALARSSLLRDWFPCAGAVLSLAQTPTRLPCPWDSPGKNTGVGCHFLLQCMKVKSEREVAQSCLTLSDPMDFSPPGSSVHGIFQAGVLEWGAVAFSYPPSLGFSRQEHWSGLPFPSPMHESEK